MKRRREFDRFFRAAFLAAAGRSLWLIGVFVASAILLEVAANLIYDLLLLDLPLTRALLIRMGAVGGALLVIAGLFFLLDLRQVRKTKRWEYELEVRSIVPHAGLIWLLSPENPEPLLKVMQHHTTAGAADEDRLEHCWLILSDHPAMESTYKSLPDQMERWGIEDVTLHPVYLPQTGVEETYRAVRRIYDHEAPACGLRSDQVVTDLTGGLKIMTAGALLGCLLPSGDAGPIEYLLSQRDPITGEHVEGSERPMKLDVTFFPRHQLEPEASTV